MNFRKKLGVLRALLLMQSPPLNRKVMLINKGLYEYGYFNACLLENMMSLMVYALSKGYIPYIELKDRGEGWSNWTTFFEQPYPTTADVKPDCVCELKQGDYYPTFSTPYNKLNLRLWCYVYRHLVRLNPETKAYVEKEYNTLLVSDSGQKRKLLGVICRGTDYVKRKPSGHPVQPSVEQVIERAKVLLEQYRLESIYLATEEYAIHEKFEKAFPGLIIVNQRQYYDEIFNARDLSFIYQVQFERENDIYLKGLEYLSSLQLLSRCDVLLGGNCGGACAALYMNNMRYKHTELFNLGVYS